LVPAFPIDGRLDTPTAPMSPIDPQTAGRRQEILDLFHSLPLKNHFEVLGVESGSSDAAVKRAYVSLAKRFHPDVQHDPQLADLRDALEAIFIRVGEAWDELRDARSRSAYASRLSHDQPQPTRLQAPTQSAYVAPEDILLQAQLLLAQSHYWDLIQLLEGAIPKMERYQSRARILLARGYAKNPNWLRRAEETLHQVIRDEPGHVDAHYDLGLLYKAGGLAARAQAMFRRTLELRPDHREAAAELAAEAGASSGGLLKRLFGRGKAS
jgi:tetratricopeptide (TPR) repeat protein